MLNVRKVAIQANLIRQQKVSTPRESSQTELFRFAMKRYSLLLEKLCKLHPKICFFGPSRVYPKSVHSVHTPKLVGVFFKNKIGTPGTQILRKNFGFGQNVQKMLLRSLFLKKKLTIRWGKMSDNFI
mgnify:CR=1 FL=1